MVSDCEDAQDVVTGALLRDFRTVVDQLSETGTETSTESESQPTSSEPSVTREQAKQKRADKKIEARIRKCVQIKGLLDQHRNIMAMPPEDRKQLTGQLLRHLQEWSNVEDKRLRKSQRQNESSTVLTSTTDNHQQSPIRPEAEVQMNGADDREAKETTIVESDDDDIHEDEIIRNVSQTLEMQLASAET